MKVFRTADEMRAWSRTQRAAGKSIGFVPTMGALHEGHASLMRAAAERDDVSVLSIFVNPTQFAPNEDLDRYPRTWDADCALAEEVGMDAIYAPTASGMYAEDYSTFVEVGGVSEGLCSKTRPHFFRGVATVVTKLFLAIEPDRAYFGLKDAQQCAVIQRMVRDLDMGIEIVPMPLIREADGLALSSRNKYLSPEERTRALCISRSLLRAQATLQAGERDAVTIVDSVRQGMAETDIDYVALVDASSMQPVARVEGPVFVAVAAKVGETRLIDNIRFDPAEEGA